MSSTNGLTCTEVIRIIGACKRAGVKSLEFKGLRMSIEESLEAGSWDEPVGVKFLDNGADVQYNKKDTEILDKVNESEIEELKITNPQAYEEIMERMNV